MISLPDKVRVIFNGGRHHIVGVVGLAVACRRRIEDHQIPVAWLRVEDRERRLLHRHAPAGSESEASHQFVPAPFGGEHRVFRIEPWRQARDCAVFGSLDESVLGPESGDQVQVRFLPDRNGDVVFGEQGEIVHERDGAVVVGPVRRGRGEILRVLSLSEIGVGVPVRPEFELVVDRPELSGPVALECQFVGERLVIQDHRVVPVARGDHDGRRVRIGGIVLGHIVAFLLAVQRDSSRRAGVPAFCLAEPVRLDDGTLELKIGDPRLAQQPVHFHVGSEGVVFLLLVGAGQKIRVCLGVASSDVA